MTLNGQKAKAYAITCNQKVVCCGRNVRLFVLVLITYTCILHKLFHFVTVLPFCTFPRFSILKMLGDFFMNEQWHVFYCRRFHAVCRKFMIFGTHTAANAGMVRLDAQRRQL